MLWDVAAMTAARALDGLHQRGEVRAHNIANSDTPGFRAQHVDFERTLADAVRRGDPATATADVVASPTIIDGMGNSVDLETELIGSMEDALLRDTVTAAFNFKAAQLRLAFGGRR